MIRRFIGETGSAESDFCKVNLDDSKKVATLLWKREVKSHEFQEGCRQLASLFTENNIQRCLIESANRGTLSTEAEEWVSILKEHVSVQANQLQVAFVMSEERYQNLIYDYTLSNGQAQELPVLFNYFTNIDEGLDWLLYEQTSPV